MYIDVVKTIKKIIREDLKEFWTSQIWKDCVADGTLIKSNASFFSEALHDHLGIELIDITSKFICSSDLSYLSKSLLYDISIEDFVKIISNIAIPQKSLEPHLLHLATSDNIESVLLINSLLNPFRDRLLRFLIEEENILNALIQQLNLKQLDEATTMDYVKKIMAFVSHRRETPIPETSLESLTQIVLNILVFHARLSFAKLSRPMAEAIFDTLDICYEAVEISKKRKVNSKKAKIKFVGWKIDTANNVNYNTQKESYESSQMVSLEEVPWYISSYALSMYKVNN